MSDKLEKGYYAPNGEADNNDGSGSSRHSDSSSLNGAIGENDESYSYDSMNGIESLKGGIKSASTVVSGRLYDSDGNALSSAKRGGITSAMKTEPATGKEIWGWWMYMAAIEPISIVVLQLFFTLIMHEFAKAAGYMYDPTGKNLVPYDASVAETDVDGKIKELPIYLKCFGHIISATTFQYATITTAVLLQAILFLFFGSLADYGGMRKRLLIVFTVLGSCACASIAIPYENSIKPYMAAFIIILTTILFGVSLMLYNSYLPLLASAHPRTLRLAGGDPIEQTHERERVANSLSAKSFMMGYGAGALVLSGCIASLFYFEDHGTTVLVYSVAAAGLWWLLVSIFPFMVLKSRRGPKLPPGTNFLTFSAKKTFHTLSKWRRLPQTFLFLMAFFLFADGCNTMGVIAVVFAKAHLNASATVIAICSLIAPICGVVGNLFFHRLQRWTRWSTKTMLITTLLCLGSLAIYCSLGMIKGINFGLRHTEELYFVAGSYGFLMGAMMSFSRVIYGEMIPPGGEAEFFAIYAITDKGASWVGPLLQAFVEFMQWKPQVGILALAVMILAPLPLLFKIDPYKGKADALVYVGATKSKIEEELQHIDDATSDVSVI